jgi:hypothetical protein
VRCSLTYETTHCKEHEGFELGQSQSIGRQISAQGESVCENFHRLKKLIQRWDWKKIEIRAKIPIAGDLATDNATEILNEDPAFESDFQLSRDLCSKSFLESHFQYGFNSLGNGS